MKYQVPAPSSFAKEHAMANRRDPPPDSAATQEYFNPGCEESDIELRHQTLEIEVDFINRKLFGTSELFIIPQRSGISHIRLNSRQIVINKIELNGLKAEFKLEDFLSTLIVDDDIETKCLKEEFKTKITAALKTSDDGELIIYIPEELLASSQDPSTRTEENSNWMDVEHNDVGDATSNVNNSNSNQKLNIGPCSEFHVKIRYELENPKFGAYFVERDAEHLKRRFPQFYCCGRNGSARCWMPCIDSSASRCTWEFRIICPYDLGEACPELYSDVPLEELAVCEDIGPENLIKFVAVAPGILKSRSQYGTENKILTVYESEILISATDISIAVATFDYIPVPQSTHYAQEQSEYDNRDSQHNLLPGPCCFFLPYRRNHAAYTMSTYSHAVNFFEQHFDLQLRFPNFKIVFMEYAYNTVIYGAGVIIADSNLLLQENTIDQFYETILHLVQAIASQWIVYYLFPQKYDDYWLISGMLSYFTNIYLKKILGLNEFKYKLRKDMITVCRMDVNQLPLCPSKIENNDTVMELYYRRCSPIDDPVTERTNFVALKSRIVLHMMEQRAGNCFMQNMVREILSSAAIGKLSKGLSTAYFLEVASKMGTKLHIRTFADQWIYGSGCPRFSFNYNFSRKKMLVELKFSQKCTNTGFICSVNKFTGPFTIRIHEPGGAYDTEVCIDDVEKKFDIQYHTKYKRIRRKLPVTKGKKQQQSRRNPSGELSNTHEDSSDKLEWLKEEPARLTFEWIRLDPDCNWLCIIDFEQSDFMWASQLQKDKDVFAQLEAVNALANMPSHGTCNVLLNTIHDTNVYYGIRIEAANALAKCVSNSKLYSAHKNVIQMYRDNFQKHSSEEDNLSGTSKSQNFIQIQDYFVQKAVLNGISYIRGPDGQAPADCHKLIFSLLKYNDNANSTLSDNYYVACLIACLGNLFLPGPYSQSNDPQVKNTPITPVESTFSQTLNTTVELDFDIDNASEKEIPYFCTTDNSKYISFKRAISEIQKYRKLDFLVYSYRNTITTACLKVYAEWMKNNVIPHQLELFMAHTKYGNFSEIRTLSIDFLLELDGIRCKPVFEHLLKLMTTDKDPYVRYYTTVKIFDKLRKRALELSSTDMTIPPAVQVDKKTCDTNDWLSESVYLLKGINIAYYLKMALESADSRIYINLFNIIGVLFWPYKMEKGAASRELPKLKIKMPELKHSDSTQQLSDSADIFLLSSKGANSYIKHVGSPAIVDSSTLSPIPEDREEVFASNSVEDKFKYILTSIIKRLQSHHLAAAYARTPISEDKATHSNRTYSNFAKITSRIQENYYALNLEAFVQQVWPIVENICAGHDSNSGEDLEYASFFQKVMDKYINIILKHQDLNESAIISKRSLSKIYEPIQFSHSRLKKSLTMNTGELVLKKPRIKFNVSSTSFPETVEIAEQMTISQIKLCCNIWAEIYKLTKSTWFKQDPKDSYTEITNEHRKSDYVDMFTMLKNIIQSVYKLPDMFRDQFQLTASTLLEKRGIQNPQFVDQILEVRSIFKKSWRSNQLLYQKLSPSPPGPLSITDDTLKQGAFADFVINPRTKSCLLKYLDILKMDSNAFEFLKPVPKTLYPSYYDIIVQPMDITKIRKNLMSGVYTFMFELEQDVRLMFRNCYKFNHPTGPVYIQGRLLEKKFNSLWNISELIECQKKPDTPGSSEKIQIYRPLKITFRPTIKLSSSNSGRAESSVTPHETLPKSIESSNVQSSNIELMSPDKQSDRSAGSRTRLKIKSSALKSSQKKMCMNIIKSLQAYPRVSYFLECNESGRKRKSYSDGVSVKNPINLLVMKKRVNDGTYGTPEQFKADFERMMQNFFVLYPPDVEAHQYGTAFEALFESEYKTFFGVEDNVVTQNNTIDDQSKLEHDPTLTKILKSMSTIPAVRDKCDEIEEMELTDLEVATINNFLYSLEKKDYALIFSEPVDPEHLKNYYDVIKTPMDLRTVKERLDNKYYRNLSDFDFDIRLIVNNCYTYNPPASYGYDCGVKFEKFYNLRLKQIASTVINRFITKNIGKVKPNKRTAQDSSILLKRERRRRSSTSATNTEQQSDQAEDAEKEGKLHRQSPHKQAKALKLTLKLRK